MKDFTEGLVSIIVPVYNAEKYLDECIESILKQSYVNYEVLLVDDGSTDGSAAICDAYAWKDKRIKVFHQNNAGVSAARNKGIEEACGEYIAFLDSDDSLKAGHMEGLMNCMKKYQCDLAIGDVCFLQENRVWDNGWIKEEQCFGVHDYLLKVQDDFPNVAIGSTCNKLFSHKTISQEALFFRKDKNYSEDYMFNAQYLKHCHSIAVLPQSGLCYRLKEEDSLSKTKLSFEENLTLWEAMYLDFCGMDNGPIMGSRGYVRLLTNCISEEIQKGGKAGDVSAYLKAYFKNQERWTYLKKAKICGNYPYCITGILFKWKCFLGVGKLFELANFLRGRKS